MKRTSLFVTFASGLWLSSFGGAWAQSGCLPPPQGLMAWWRGELTALDSAGTNDAATIGGVLFTNAEVGQGFSLSGTGDDYVELPQNIFPVPGSGAEGATPFSFEVWFRTLDGGVILGQQDSAPFLPPSYGNVPGLYVTTNGTLYASLFWSGGTQLSSPAIVNDNQFHHVVVTFDGSTETLYLDGQTVDSTPFVQQGYADSYYYQLGTGWTDGWTNTPGGWFPFKGVIDEASFYNRALAPLEVSALFTVGAAGKCPPSASMGLRHRYSFNAAPGSTRVNDSVGGAYGTLYFASGTAPYTNGAPDGSGFTGNGSLRLTGTNGFVQLPPGLISSFSNVTFEAWVTWNGPVTSVWQRIFDFGFSDRATNTSGIGTNYMILCPSRGGSQVLGFEETSVNPFGNVADPNALVLNAPVALPVGRPVYIAVSYDPVAGESKLYLDGALVASVSGTFNPLARMADKNNWLGRSQWERDPFFNGQLDEFRIWQGILDPTDVANHHAYGPDQPFGTPRPLLQIARAASQVTLWWNTNAASGFQLETAADIRSGVWQPITNAVSVHGNQYQVTLPTSGAAALYRLRY